MNLPQGQFVFQSCDTEIHCAVQYCFFPAQEAAAYVALHHYIETLCPGSQPNSLVDCRN